MNNHKSEQSTSLSSTRSPIDSTRAYSKDVGSTTELWTDGLICAFEFVPGHKRKSKFGSNHRNPPTQGKLDQEFTKWGQFADLNNLSASNATGGCLQEEKGDVILKDIHGQEPGLLYVNEPASQESMKEMKENAIAGRPQGADKRQKCYWVPIGWARLSELVQMVQVDAEWVSQPMEYSDEEDSLTVADIAAPYWQRPAGPTWWCHVTAGHPFIDSWLKASQWLHPAISTALRDESRLISDRMKHLYYEVTAPLL
eukprot:Gb_15329 [translate_table: standard]